MTSEEKVKYWVDLSDEDFRVAKHKSYNNGRKRKYY